MSSFSDEQKQNLIKWLGIPSAIFFIAFCLTAGVYFAFVKNYENKIYPNIYVGQIKIGDLTVTEAQDHLDREADRLIENGIPFILNDHEINLMPIATTDGDATIETINFDTEKTIAAAFAIGHNQNFLDNLKERVLSLLYNHYTTLAFTLNEELVGKFITDNFSQYENPEKNATLSYTIENGAPKFSIQTSEAGKLIDRKKAIAELKNNLTDFNSHKITLEIKPSSPKLNPEKIKELLDEANLLAGKAPFTLLYKKQKWEIGKKQLADFLTIGRENEIILDQEKLTEFLMSKIATKINIAPIEAKFQMTGTKITKFQANRDGVSLDIETSIAKIENDLKNNATSTNLITITQKTSTSTQDVENLGIKEIIGIGKSNFSGSPKNRVWNIRTGANAVNGRLIAPGEEFSLLKTLGKIDGSTGYKPELVIKENKTTPEFGGGLCQIGTTVFRGATESGLPITQRRNHSYRVSYYEPAGTDATIYDPAPDFRFRNDTANHILIQSRFEGSNLFFEFWGTKDGRQVEKAYPTIYNIVKPQPTKIIETKDLKPGEKKCTEKAHNGADAYFDYKVTYPINPSSTSTEPEIKKTRFTSHYVPWREVCLVGIDPKKASSTPDIIASSTATIISTTTKKIE